MIELIPMSEEDLEEYLKTAVENYASEKVKSGNWRQKEAFERSKKEYARLLPNGVKTEGHHLFTIKDGVTGRKVGMIWVGVSGTDNEIDGAWIWDFSINERERGKGFGKETLKALDAVLSGLGQRRISLQVFGHNEVAINLYKKSGYHITNLVMSKNL
jgi:RimJ/RimL family protein N-acetyltransferase